jgi:hypothetical protein
MGEVSNPPPFQHPQGYPPPPPGTQPPPSSCNQTLLKEADLELLKELLNNSDEAQSFYSMLQNSPPEIAALGYLILRVFERSKS